MRFQILTITLIILFLLSLYVNAQQGPMPQGDLYNFGFYLRNVLWTKLGKHITVCWENPSPNNSEKRQLVQNSIHNTWEAVSDSIKKGTHPFFYMDSR